MRNAAISTAAIWIGLVLGLSACGGSSKSSDDSHTAGGSAVSGAAGGGATICARETCKLPEGMQGELCCVDAFAGGCGIKSSSGMCLAFPKIDPRCPAPDLNSLAALAAGSGASDGGVMGFFVQCCGSNNECGIDYGTGCMSVASLCAVLPKYLTATIRPATCEGSPLKLPDNCGTDGNFMIPGSAGTSGGS